MPNRFSGSGEGEVEHLTQLVGGPVGDPEPEPGVGAVEDEPAERVAEKRPGLLLPPQPAAGDPGEPGQAAGQGARPPAPADPEADLDGVRRLVVQRRDGQL